MHVSPARTVAAAVGLALSSWGMLNSVLFSSFRFSSVPTIISAWEFLLGLGQPWVSNDVGHWKSMVLEKRLESHHVVFMIDEEHDLHHRRRRRYFQFSCLHHSKHERSSLSPDRPDPFPALRVPKPFFDWTAPRTSRRSGFSVSPIQSSSAISLCPMT